MSVLGTELECSEGRPWLAVSTVSSPTASPLLILLAPATLAHHLLPLPLEVIVTGWGAGDSSLFQGDLKD